MLQAGRSTEQPDGAALPATGPAPARPTTAAVLCVLGLAALLAADWCANLANTGTPSGGHGMVGGYVFRLAIAAGCVCGALRPGLVKRFRESRAAMAALLAALLVGHALLVYGPLSPVPGAAKAIGGVIGGLAYAFLLLAWLAAYCRFEPRTATVAFCSAYLLIAVVYFVLAALDRPVAAAVVAVLPFVSGAFYAAACRSMGEEATAQGNARPGGQGEWSFPLYPVALMVVFKFAFNFSLAYSNGASMHGPLGILAVGSLALFAALVLYDSFNPSVLYKLALPCMVAGLILLEWVAPGDNAATLASNAGNIAFELFILITLADTSRRFAVNPVWLFGIVEGASYLVSLLGKLLGRLFIARFAADSLEAGVAMLVLVVGLVAISAFFFDERMAARTFGGIAGDRPGAGAAHGEDSRPCAAAGLSGLALQCASVSRAYGLSRREEETLELLAQGMSVAQIEAELSISRSTVKSHIQHIYEKLGIHTREEARSIVEAQSARLTP